MHLVYAIVGFFEGLNSLSSLGGFSTSGSSNAVKKLLLIFLACGTRGVHWQGCTVCCHSISQSVVWVINEKDSLLSEISLLHWCKI